MSGTEIHLTTEELAIRLSVSPDTVRYWRQTGTGPEWRKFGRSVRYLLRDVQKWEAASYGGKE